MTDAFKKLCQQVLAETEASLDGSRRADANLISPLARGGFEEATPVFRQKRQYRKKQANSSWFGKQ